MKKIVAFLMAAVFLVLTAGCSKDSGGTVSKSAPVSSGAGESSTVEKLPDMTKENITLTYASWHDTELNEVLAKKFTEKYPNITVKILPMVQDTYNDDLNNLASSGQLPDVFCYLGNCDIPLRNGWLGDITQYFESDPETENILDTLKPLGYFDGKHKLAAAIKFMPYTIYLDKALFKKYNVAMPDPDWKWSDMIALMKKMTNAQDGVYGYNDYTLMLTMYPIVNRDADGEFGWNSETQTYDLTGEWAEALQLQAEFIRNKIHAPAYGSEEAKKAFGDGNLWAAATGKVAMQLDAWWTCNNLFLTDEYKNKGIQWVPYVVPKGDSAKTEHKPAFIDMGGISSATEHPREAYELLKWMGWDTQAWKIKIEAFQTLKNKDGTKKYKASDCLPLTKDQGTWDSIRKLYPEDSEYDGFFKYCKEPIALGGAVQPGFSTFLDEVYNNGDWGGEPRVEQAVIDGKVKAADVAPELTKKINEYRKEAMDELFQN